MIYLDNAATSFPKAPNVGNAMKNAIEKNAGNAARSSYPSSRFITNLHFETKNLLADLLNIPSPKNIIFTLNATHALNIILLGTIKENQSVITSKMEHNAVIRPLYNLKRKKNININFFDSSQTGKIIENDINKKNNFIIINSISNVNGQIQPIREIIKKNKDKISILDLSQSVGYIPLNIKEIDPDFIAFPGHKGLLGPSGIGFAWAKDWNKTEPLILGGTGSHSESFLQPLNIPDKFESGTQNNVAIAGMIPALKFLIKTGTSTIYDKKKYLHLYFVKKLKEIDNINIINSENSFSGVISITSNKFDLDQITLFLDKNEVASRMGLHCAPLAHKTLRTFENGGTVRFSLSFFNTKKEINIVVDKLKTFLKGKK